MLYYKVYFYVFSYHVDQAFELLEGRGSVTQMMNFGLSFSILFERNLTGTVNLNYHQYKKICSNFSYIVFS